MTAGEEKEDGNSPAQDANVVEDSWAIRPCMLYKEEYDDCTSFKARFHQYFIHGKSTDCSQWKVDYNNCLRYENINDATAGNAIVASEKQRRMARMKAHYGNDVWKKRAAPPEDWNKPLPEWLVKKNENTLLDLKAKEMSAGAQAVEEKSYCVVM